SFASANPQNCGTPPAKRRWLASACRADRDTVAAQVSISKRRRCMLKTLMITTALTGLMAGSVLAQSTPAQTDSMQPQATQPASPKDAERAPTSSPSMTQGQAKFINAQATDQWLSSSFIGVDVVGPDNEKIG